MSSPDIMQNSNHYNRQYSEVFGCSHFNKITYQEKSFCQQCGIFTNNSNTRVYKTLKMKYNAFFDPIKILNITLQGKTLQEHNQNRLSIIEFLEQATDRLRLSFNTLFLAMNYMDKLFVKQQIPENQLYLYASAALMVAAKAQELDERIPFISKLKRYASMTNHPEINSFRNDEFKFAERVIIQTMEWNLQQITLYDKIEALLSFGVVDDDDSLSSQSSNQKENKNEELRKSKVENQLHQKMRDLNDQQILYYVKEIESKYTELALSILKEDNLYFQTDQSILALSCVAYLRKKAGLLNIWSQQLQSLTGMSAQKISATVSQIMTIMGKFQNKLYRNLTHHTYLETNNNIQHPQVINTPTTIYPLASFPYNSQPNRFLFEKNKNSVGETSITNLRGQTKFTAPPTLFTSQSTLSLSRDVKMNDSKIKKGRNNQFTYLNLNENMNHPSYLNHFSSHNQELDKKYEQVHKVSNNSMLRTKIYPGLQQQQQ